MQFDSRMPYNRVALYLLNFHDDFLKYILPATNTISFLENEVLKICLRGS